MEENKPEQDSQFQIPTRDDILNLEIKAKALGGSGETVHAIDSVLRWLRSGFEEIESKKTWDNIGVQKWWSLHVGYLNKEFLKRQEEIAREKGLL